MREKIVSQPKLFACVRRLKSQGKVVVATCGGFDLLHSGHVFALEDAKKQGDVLVVLLNSDASVKLFKGPTRPIQDEGERATMLAALAAVDYVTLFDEINPKRILERIQPHVYSNSSEWGRWCIESEVVQRYGGTLHIVRRRQRFSTTDLIERLGAAAPAARAVFLDRDGTLIENGPPGYTHRIKEVRFLPGAIEALKRLSKTDYKIIIVTNQSGIARAYFSRAATERLHRWFIKTLKEKGARIDRIYYCPHRPEDGCACRKPAVGMFLEAVKDFGVSLAKSWMVGDDARDVLAGREGNMVTIKVAGAMPRGFSVRPQYAVKDLAEAVKIILRA